MKVIGFSGKMGVGKTTIARLMGFPTLSFAGQLYKTLGEHLGLAESWLRMNKNQLVQIGERTITVRQALQEWGERMRWANPEVWVNALREEVRQYEEKGVVAVAVDDVRRVNEFRAIRDLGGSVYRLEPYDGWRPGEHSDHHTETELDGWPHFSRIYKPRFGTEHLATIANHIVLREFPADFADV